MAGPPVLPPAPRAGRACPFCGEPAPDARCATCGRDPTAPRRPCDACGRIVPSADPACWSCGAPRRNEMRRKVPLIVLMFLAAIALSVVLAGL